MASDSALRVLILDDTPTDAELMERELRQAGLVFRARRVDTEDAFREALAAFRPDVILSDYKLPGFDGMTALKIARREHPEVPVIMVTGAVPDIEAVEFLHAGAKDYVLKDRMARLGGAVREALSAERSTRARKAAEETLRRTLQRSRTQSEAVGALAMSEALVAGEVERFAREVTEAVCRATGCERANVWLFGDGGNELRCIDLYEATPARHSAGALLHRAQFENEFRAIIEDKCVAADDPLTDPRTAGYVEGYLKPLGITAMLDALIHVSGRNLGLLCFEHVGRPHRWEQDEIAFAIQLANLLALALSGRERLQAQRLLLESEAKFRSIAAAAQDAIIMLDERGRLAFWNAAAERLFGYTAEEVGERDFHELLAPERYRADYRREFAGFAATGAGPIVGRTLELAALRKDGGEFPVELSVSALRLGERWHAIGILRDISERKRAEARVEDELRAMSRLHAIGAAFLHESDLQTLLDKVVESAIVLAQADMGNLQLFDAATGRLTIRAQRGFEPPWLDFWQQVAEGEGACGKALQLGERLIVEDVARSPIFAGTPALEVQLAGGVRAVVSTPLLGARGRQLGVFSVHYRQPRRPEAHLLQRLDLLARLTADFIEHMQDTEALRESEMGYRLLFESSRDPLVTIKPPSWKFADANRAAVELFGASSKDEFLSVGPWEMSPEGQPDGRPSAEKARDMIDRAMQDGSCFFEWEHCRLNGERFPADVLLTRMELDGETFIHATIRDITERKRTEAALARLSRMYRVLSLCNQALVHASDEVRLARDMCVVLTQHGGFRPAWVALLSGEGALLPAAWDGGGEDFGDWLRAAYAAEGGEQCPGREVLRTGEATVVCPLPDDPASPLAKLKAMGATCLTIEPLVGDGRPLGILCLGSVEAAPCSEEERMLYAELAGDLSFGIVKLRDETARLKLERERLGNLETLEHNLDATVAAIAATVEMRDPYTAGHQRRVARLAVAIATEMGLPKDRLDGIRIAGVVHDIGKIHVPAEILANPDKLTDAEFEIIKTHPKAGYDILKDIAFNWPVAEIVYQHHERLDGSGYPRGLKGDAILLEARILSIADVVEAMASHRPYRPGHGIFPALQEISSHKGVKYDAAAADACLRLFLEKGYAL